MPVRNDKAAIRRAVRGAFPGETVRQEESLALCRHVLDWEAYRRARVIGGYMPVKHEADVTPILLDALATGKKLALPRCGKAPEMCFHQVKSLNELVPGAYGLLEPRPDAPVVPSEEINLLLTPLEALTREGWRLGKGGGYYDHLLREKSLLAAGMVMSWQWIKALPRDSWDQPLRAAADAQGIHLF